LIIYVSAAGKSIVKGKAGRDGEREASGFRPQASAILKTGG
jgi:hypothetical protein